MSKPFQPVFVYGTLRRGGSNHFRMDGAEFMGAGSVRARLYRITWYPGLVADEAARPVRGEVYAVGPEQLRALDEFEGVSAEETEGSEYRRVKALVSLDDGSAMEAWIWEWLGRTEEGWRIPGGDWLAGDPPE